MPLSVDNLTEKSNIKHVKDAINKSVGHCMDEGGRTQDECLGMVYGIARKKTGRKLEKK